MSASRVWFAFFKLSEINTGSRAIILRTVLLPPLARQAKSSEFQIAKSWGKKFRNRAKALEKVSFECPKVMHDSIFSRLCRISRCDVVLKKIEV